MTSHRSHLQFIEHDAPEIKDAEDRHMRHVVVMTVLWKGLLFLEAVKYVKSPDEDMQSWDDEDDEEDEPVKATPSPTKANGYTGFEKRVYVNAKMPEFRWACDVEINAFNDFSQVREQALKAERKLVEFVYRIQTRRAV